MTINYLDSKRIVGLSKSTTVANTKPISSQTTNVIDLAVKHDGTEIYVATEDTGKIITYELATAGDVSTAVYNSSKDYTHSLTNPKGMDWNNDGTKIYLASFNSEAVHTYTVSPAYDLSATVTSVATNDLSGIDGAQALQWSHDGAYLFQADNSGVIHRYEVTTAFVVSDGTRTSFNPSETTAVTGISFGDNGKEMYIVSHANTGLFKYTLSPAYDLSTATHDSTLTTTDADNQGIATSNGKIYVLGQTTDIVTDYNNDIKPTNVQDNSILVEKDTGRRYWFDAPSIDTSGLKAYYKFDEASGNIINQHTTGDGLASADLTTTGVTYGVTGIISTAVSCDGSNDFMVSPSATKTDFNFIHALNQAWSINIWFKKANANDGGITAFIANRVGSDVGIRIKNLDRSGEGETRKLQLEIDSGSAGSAVAMYDSNVDSFFPNDTDWHMLTITADNSITTNAMQIYLDGTLNHNVNRVGVGDGGTPEYPMNFAQEGDGTDYGDYTFDETSFWTRKLSSTDVTTLYNSDSGFAITPATWTWDFAITRGLFMGNYNPTYNNIQYITIATTGNTNDFGDLTVARGIGGGVSSDKRTCMGGGFNGSNLNVIDYVTTLTTGNAVDFGDRTITARGGDGCDDLSRGIFWGGQAASLSNVIDYITIASTGNATDFGDQVVAHRNNACVADTTRAVCGGGTTGAASNIIDYVTIQTTGNSTDFGNLTTTGDAMSGAVASETRAVFGVRQFNNVLDYITILTTGNATDFGDLVADTFAAGATYDLTRGVWAGGDSDQTRMNYITIATTGNGTDFGDVSPSGMYSAGGRG